MNVQPMQQEMNNQYLTHAVTSLTC